MKRTFTKLFAIALVLVLSIASASAATLQIGIPDDSTNLSRGIKLLEKAGFITVRPEAGYTPELADVTEYLYDIEIVPTQANTLPATLADFAASAINGTYAQTVGLNPERDGLITEEQLPSDVNPYVNIIVARTADADNETYKTIVEAYQTQLVAEFLLVNYENRFQPCFEYDAEAEFTITPDNVKEYVRYTSDKAGKTVVKIGVCGSDNDQWAVVQRILDEKDAGIYLELVTFDAYNLPNEALNSGEIDLNAFQHKAYLNNDAGANGYDVVAIGDTLIAPLTLYSEKFDSLDALKEAAGLVG